MWSTNNLKSIFFLYNLTKTLTMLIFLIFTTIYLHFENAFIFTKREIQNPVGLYRTLSVKRRKLTVALLFF